MNNRDDYVEKKLIEAGIQYERNKTFDGCVYLNKLKFSFYLPEYHACIIFDNDEQLRSKKFLRSVGGTYISPINAKRIKSEMFKTRIKSEFCRLNDIQTIVIKNEKNLYLIPQKIMLLEKYPDICSRDIVFRFQPFVERVTCKKSESKGDVNKECLVDLITIDDTHKIPYCSREQATEFREIHLSNIESVLQKYKLSFEKGKKFDGCYSLAGHKLSYSYYISELNCCVIYDSPYNSMLVGDMLDENKKKSNLQRAMTHLEAKKRFCDMNEIKLIIVKFNDNINKFETQLKGIIL